MLQYHEQDEFTQGAIQAAFFTCDPFVSSGEYVLDPTTTWDLLSAEDQHRFVDACAHFQTVALEGRLDRIRAITENSPEKAGRDYHYTSQGHGCGFWDGDWGERLGDVLTSLAKRHKLPELHADIDCERHHETGEACGDCEECENHAVAYFLE